MNNWMNLSLIPKANSHSQNKSQIQQIAKVRLKSSLIRLICILHLYQDLAVKSCNTNITYHFCVSDKQSHGRLILLNFRKISSYSHSSRLIMTLKGVNITSASFFLRSLTLKMNFINKITRLTVKLILFL